MKNAKKWLALGLTAAMLTGLAGCGQTDETVESSSQPSKETEVSEVPESSTVVEEKKDPITLEIWYNGNGIQKDTEKVETAFNELLQTFPGMEHVSVHLNPEIAGDYKNNVLLAQSAGTQIDLLHSYRLDLGNEVANGTYLALDDMLADNPELVDVLPDWLWDLGKVDGVTYIVPGYQRAASNMYFITPKEYMDKYGDIDKIRTVIQREEKDMQEIADTMVEYLLAVREGEGETKYLPGFDFTTNWSFTERYDGLADTFFRYADGGDVGNILMTEEALQGYEIAADLYEKGYIHPDVMTITALDYDRANMLNDVSFIYGFNNQAGDEEAVSKYYSTAYGFDCYAIPVWTNYHIGYSWAAGGWGIAANSEYPEEALRFIELMNTTEGVELYNMIVYGLEDVHYTKIDDKHIKTLEYDGTQGAEGHSYAAMKWIMGNTSNIWLNQGCAENEAELANEINTDPNNLVSPLSGIRIKTDSIQTQLEQTRAIVSEYRNQITSGALGDKWKDTYDEFVSKMEAAGMQDIIDELQSQVDAYLAK